MIISYKESAVRLLQHLSSKITDKGYPDNPTWGYAFSFAAALEFEPDIKINNFANQSLALLNQQDKSHKSYSWEFVVYACNRSMKLCDNLSLHEDFQYNEKGTRMINWTLLRQLNRINYKKDSVKVRLILWSIKQFFTLDSGQILDEISTRSLQYHAFCLFILAELDQTKYHPMVSKWLIKGCKFSAEMVLRNGTALYIGRGQEQIFGYGALLFALEYTNTKYKLGLDSKIVNIWHYLQAFQRKDGSYPLVLIPNQPEKPEVSFTKDIPHGWFGYNTLYDYQPFLAYCLLRAEKFKKGNYV